MKQHCPHCGLISEGEHFCTEPRLSYRVFWASQDREWVATTYRGSPRFASLSYLASTPDEALRGLVHDVIPAAHRAIEDDANRGFDL